MTDPFFRTVVVAAGVRNGKVRLCVNLVPKGKVDIAVLKAWPDKIDEFFQKGALLRVYSAVTIPDAKQLSQLVTTLPTLSLLYVKPQNASKLWTELTHWSAAAGDKFWDALQALFDEQQKHTGYIVGADNKLLIAPSRRADAALLHLFERAERTAAMMLAGWEAPKKGSGAEFVSVASPRKLSKDDVDALSKKASEEQVNWIGRELDRALEQTDNPAGASDPFPDLATLHLAGLLQDAPNAKAPTGVARKAAYAESSPSDANFNVAPNKNEDDRALAPQYVAPAFYAALRSYPTLARLFRFNVELTCDAPDLLKLVKTYYDPKTGGLESEKGPGRAAFLLVCMEGETDAKSSICKLRLDSKGEQILDFWPATREEMQGAYGGATFETVRKDCKAAQIDGVIDLGQSTAGAKRYELVSLDAIQAMESSLHALDPKVRISRKEKDGEVSFAMPAGKARKALMPVGRSFSRGLAIVDRQRVESIRAEIANSRNNIEILDATDLTVGYRADVACREVAGKSEWRSLMDRTITFHGYEATLDRSALKQGSTDRIALDAAIIMPASRIRLLADAADGPRRMIHPEETLVAWEGDPLALNCGDGDIDLKRGQDIGLSRTFELPQGAGAPWRLVFGQAYRMGLRAVWMGGVSLPAREAGRIYDDENMALPTGRDKIAPWRRFLRHEQIHPPVVLLPRGIATERTSYGRQSATQLILRRVNPSSNVGAPDIDVQDTWRLILPPRVSRDMAGRHGSLALTGAHPTGAFHDVVYAARDGKDGSIGAAGAGGGKHAKKPPVSTSPAKTSSPAKASVADLAPEYSVAAKGLGAAAGAQAGPGLDHAINPEAGFPVYGNPTGRPRAEGFVKLNSSHFAATAGSDHHDFGYYRTTGEPVFEYESRTQISRDKDEYYTDPMCSMLVIAVRPIGTEPGAGYFDGKPLVIDLGGGENPQDFAKILPVALQAVVRATAPAPDTRPTQAHFLALDPAPKLIGDGKSLSNGKLKARVATLSLGAGESVEVDLWYAPSHLYLCRYFDAPETLAALVLHGRTFARDKRETCCAQVLTALRAVQTEFGTTQSAKEPKGLLAAMLAAYDKYQASSKVAPHWIGADDLAIDPLVLALVAAALHAAMLERPVPEIAAVRTLGAVFAVAKPPRAPLFNLAGKAMRAYRTTDGRRKDDQKGLMEGKPPHAISGDDTFILSGDILFDRDTCRQIEVVAECVSPGRNVFDDVRLGRTLQQQLLGEWPDRIVAGLDGGAEHSRKARYLFGFDLDRDGTVHHVRQNVTVVQIDHVAETEEGERNEIWKSESLDLAKETSKSGEAYSDLESSNVAGAHAPESEKRMPALRVILSDPFKDQLARKLKLHLRATSRFDSYFLKIVPDAATPAAETMFPSDVDTNPKSRLLITATSVDAPTAKPAERCVEIQIPATIRPAKPQIHTVLPSFHRTKRPAAEAPVTEAECCYSTRLRIYLDRPWFSSGEGERLGVVLWPPRLRKLAAGADPGSFHKAQIPRAHLFADGTSSETSIMSLADIADEDLGPGGQYTTRMGADPIREAKVGLGPFIPATDLLDIDSDGVEYVEQVFIPIQDPSDVSLDFNPIATLAAALITYEPRFDPELEKWFVDIDINPETLVDPFVRLGLVRYQQNALDDLKVSAPVKVWAQVRPARTAQASVAKLKDGTLRLKVQVSGHFAARMDEEKGRVHPRMLIAIRERRITLSGHVEERLSRQVSGEPARVITELVAVSPAFDRHFPLAYAKQFRLAARDVDVENPEPAMLRRLTVTVEEIDEFLSTNDEDVHAEARSSAAANVKLRAPAAAAQTPDFVDALLQEIEPSAASRVFAGPKFIAKLDLSI